MPKSSCTSTQVTNPATGRCVERSGAVGKRVLAEKTKAAAKSPRTKTAAKKSAAKSPPRTKPPSTAAMRVDPALELYRLQSAEYVNALPGYDQLCVFQYQDLADMIANAYLRNGKPDLTPSSKYLSDLYGFNNNRIGQNLQASTWWFAAQSRAEWPRTAWFQTLSKPVQQLCAEYLAEYPIGWDERKATFARYLPRMQQVLGAWIGNHFDNASTWEPCCFVMLLWSTDLGRLTNWNDVREISETSLVWGPFDVAATQRMIARLASDLTRVFGNGPALQQPLTLWRGLQEAPDTNVQLRSLQSAATCVENAIGYAGPTCCLMKIHAMPGTRSFEFSGVRRVRMHSIDEHELVLPVGARLDFVGRSVTKVENEAFDTYEYVWRV